MATVEQVYEVLVGLKIKDDAGLWHVYDQDGVEISDPGGILLRGNMGALLMWPNPVIEDLIEQHYHGSGRRKQFSDATDADLERLVRDKWELVERGQVKEKPVSFTKPEPYVREAPNIRTSSSEHSAQAPSIVPSIIATHWPVAADEVAAAALKAKQARDDEDLLLLLAELL